MVKKTRQKRKMPLIVVNFKTYKESTGDNALKLAKICEEVHKKTRIPIIVAVQDVDLNRVASHVGIPVYAQHLDPVPYGAHTGHTLAEALVANGAKGTLINHSEHRVKCQLIDDTILRAKEAGLKTIVCAPEPYTAGRVARYKPDMIAVEPPELIGGEVSVATAKPSVIKNAVKHVHEVNRNIPVLCGAGVKDSRDMAVSTKLGASGVLLASHVVKAKNPKKVLMELIAGI